MVIYAGFPHSPAMPNIVRPAMLVVLKVTFIKSAVVKVKSLADCGKQERS